VSLTSELDDPHSPISRYLRERFPHVRELQRRYREPVADAAPLQPAADGTVAYATLGAAFDWRLRYLLTPAPSLSLAALGGLILGGHLQGLGAELFRVLGGANGPSGLDDRQLARACYALALYTEAYRAGPQPGSRLASLPREADLGDLLDLATAAEVDDLLALTEAARHALLPVLSARGPALHIGRVFAGSGHVGGADADMIVGGLLVEWKVNLGDRRRDGRRRCALSLDTIHQLLGYLLLDYDDAFQIDALGVYAARYAYLVTWPLAQLLDELAGAPVDLACARADFRGVAEVTAARY